MVLKNLKNVCNLFKVKIRVDKVIELIDIVLIQVLVYQYI